MNFHEVTYLSSLASGLFCDVIAVSFFFSSGSLSVDGPSENYKNPSVVSICLKKNYKMELLHVIRLLMQQQKNKNPKFSTVNEVYASYSISICT